MPIKKVPAPMEPVADTIESSTAVDGIIPNSEAKVNGKKRYNPADRQRAFATVIYPGDSAPDDWLEKLRDVLVPALVSPLHDSDVNPDGVQKKSHRHVMLMFESVKNFDTQVKPIFDSIGGVGREIINSTRGYARYLCHLDNPEKYQYAEKDVIQLCGADYKAIIHLPTDDPQMLMDIQRFIRINNIFSYAELVDYCAINNLDWYNFITIRRTYTIDKYIKSFYWEYMAGNKRKEKYKND